MLPYYDCTEFISACAEVDSIVFVWGAALKTAREDFKIFKSEADILQFIGDGGIDGRDLTESREFDGWKGDPPAPMVDSYIFPIKVTEGYMAFFRNPENGIWNLKSFKRNKNPPKPRATFAELGKGLPSVEALIERKKEEGHD